MMFEAYREHAQAYIARLNGEIQEKTEERDAYVAALLSREAAHNSPPVMSRCDDCMWPMLNCVCPTGPCW